MRSALVLAGLLLSSACAHAQGTRVEHVAMQLSPGGGGPSAGGVVQAQVGWMTAAPGQAELAVGADGAVHIGVWVRPPAPSVAAQAVAQRLPMSVALVIDTSGSMAGEKIANARIAAASLLETLADGDLVSVYAFSSDVRELAPPTALGPQSRPALLAAVRTLQPIGGTNLFDGLRVGEARAMEAPPSHPVRRVVVISDGMANIGPSSPDELGQIASQGTERGVQVSAIGVGLEYDEHTLGALAMRSAGRLYHLAQPSQMAAILREELQQLAETVATEATVELAPAPGVELLEVVNTTGERLPDGRLRVRLGSVRGGQTTELLVRARATTQESAALAPRQLASARFSYRPAGAQRAVSESVDLRYALTRDATRANASADPRVAAMAANFDAARVQLEAARALNAGQAAEADRALESAERTLRAAASQAAVPEEQRRVLVNRAESVARRRSQVRAAPARPAASRAGSLDLYDDAMNAYGR